MHAVASQNGPLTSGQFAGLRITSTVVAVPMGMGMGVAMGFVVTMVV